jgi:hypothetical protein
MIMGHIQGDLIIDPLHLKFWLPFLRTSFMLQYSASCHYQQTRSIFAAKTAIDNDLHQAYTLLTVAGCYEVQSPNPR